MRKALHAISWFWHLLNHLSCVIESKIAKWSKGSYVYQLLIRPFLYIALFLICTASFTFFFAAFVYLASKFDFIREKFFQKGLDIRFFNDLDFFIVGFVLAAIYSFGIIMAFIKDTLDDIKNNSRDCQELKEELESIREENRRLREDRKDY